MPYSSSRPRNSSNLMRSIEMVKGGVVFGYIQNHSDPDDNKCFVAERLMVHADRMNVNQWKNGAISFDVYVMFKNPKEPDNKDKVKVVDEFNDCIVIDGSGVRESGEFCIGEKVKISFESRGGGQPWFEYKDEGLQVAMQGKEETQEEEE